MSTYFETQIIALDLNHYTQDEIVNALKTAKNRVSRYIQNFRRSGMIPDALMIVRSSKRSNDMTIFVEA
jgi:hypothetical protein